MDTQRAAALLWERLEQKMQVPGLPESGTQRLRAMGREGISQGMARVMTVPVAFSNDDDALLHDAYYVAAWLGVAQELGGGAPLAVMEVASGDVAVVPWALELYDGGRSSYVTANLNRKLTESFLAKTASLHTAVRVIDDDGANMARYYAPGSFDMVALQHGINDIVQTILCERAGMDTVHSDWWQALPEMTRISAEYHHNGTLEAAAQPGFLACMAACAKLTRPGGHLVFNSIVYQYDLDLGYPRDLYESYVPMARRWLLEAGMGLTDVTPKGWDPRYWMVLRTANY